MKSIEDLKTQRIAVKCDSKEECDALCELVGMRAEVDWSEYNNHVRFCPLDEGTGDCNVGSWDFYERHHFKADNASNYLKTLAYEIY